jgi:hypothetical protein
MGNPVGWFEIYVDDMDRAKAFYQAVFGVELRRLDDIDHEMWGFPMDHGIYGSSGALIHYPGVKAGGNSTLVYFHSEDCGVEASKVVAAGGRVEKAKVSIGHYGHIAQVIDTEGNRIGLHSMG